MRNLRFVDEYGTNETAWHRQFYERYVFPSLHPHQRVAVVPGLFGCDVGDKGRCTNSLEQAQGQCLCSVSGHNLSHTAQADGLIAKLRSYLGWAAAETRIVGVNPWHYYHIGPASRPYPQYHEGVAAFPTLIAEMLRLGWRNVSQMRPSSACGPIRTVNGDQ